MKHKSFNRTLAAILSLMLIVGMVPTTVFASDPVENTAPAVENFATADDLRANFDMDDSTADKTFKKVYFGKSKTWSIVGVDPVGGGLVLLSQNSTPSSYFSSSTDVKDYDSAWDVIYEDGFVPEKVAPNHYGASDMRAAFQSYTESGNSACWFTDAQLDMIIPTTIYTADVYNTDDNGNPRVYHSTELLYPTYSTDYKPVSEGRIQFVTVGSNSAKNLGTELKVSLKTNVIGSFTRSAWVSGPNNIDRVLVNSNNGVDLRWADDKRDYLPVFQLDTSNVLFGSIYEGVTAEGEQKDSYDRKTFTLRMDAEQYKVDLGEAHITAPAMEYVTVNDAPEGTFLVVQCGEGAWAKAVSGDMTFSASDLSGGKITSFENCKVWLEKTDADAMLTYASYADTVNAYSVGITSNAKLVRDENSGEENQVSLNNAPIENIVYTTVEDYYFPEDYCDTLSNNGITVTRNSDTQITISGTPTSDFYLTLPVPDYCGTKDQWDGVTVASGYESGDGTTDNPYVIANSEQFAYFAQQMQSEDYNGAGEYFVLTADLELTSADWKPVFQFDGSFDGNGHTILFTQQEGMFITNDVNQRFYYFGLFGIQRGTVSNLNVSGEIIVNIPTGVKLGYLNVGGICGYTEGTVSHCSSDVVIRFEDGENTKINVGGIAGQIYSYSNFPGVVEYCGYSGSITVNATVVNAGGIAGHMLGGTIRQCFNNGTLDITAGDSSHGGGIIGSIYDTYYTNTRVIESCYNWGAVSITSSSSVNAGGIAGYFVAENSTSDASTISGCYSIGTLSSSSGNNSPLSPKVNGHVEVNNNYCLENGDKNTEKVADKAELFEKLNVYAPNTWFADKVTGDVRLLWELNVPAAPEAIFNADSENGGVLSNVVAGMMYSVDGGNTWAEITDTTVAITGVTVEKGIQVYQPGDFHETNDSPVQTIAVTKAAAPTSVGANGCTTTEQNDGMITGVNSTMEYKTADGDTWIAITGGSVTGLSPDTYLVRVKGNGTVLASEPVTVTVDKHICVAQGDWQHDENNHWKLCACGEKLGEADHAFEWVTDKEATETQAGLRHEECTVCGYAKAAVEIPATRTPTVPETGENSNIALWVAMMLAAGATLTGTVLYSRKRKYSR